MKENIIMLKDNITMFSILGKGDARSVGESGSKKKVGIYCAHLRSARPTIGEETSEIRMMRSAPQEETDAVRPTQGKPVP